MKDEITILGGGNGGCALAADLAVKGYPVSLAEFPAFADGFAPVMARQGLAHTGVIGEGFVRLKRATVNIEEAIAHARYILMSVPSFGQRAFFEACLPFLKDGQILVLVTGNMGTLEFARIMREREIRTRIILAETNTLPYGTRLMGPASIHVEYRTAIDMAAFPAKHTAEAVEGLRDIFEIHPANDVVEMGLLNTNLLLHPMECIFNAGRIEFSKGDFYSHGEGFTPVVARFSVRVYRELQSIAKAIGMHMDIWKIAAKFFGAVYNEEAARKIDEMDEDSLALYFSGAVQASPLAKIKGPGHLDYRYLTEDVPYGLVTAASIGDMVGVEAKLIKALILLASVINRKDHMKEGRTVDTLGIAGMDGEQLKAYLQEGVR